MCLSAPGTPLIQLGVPIDEMRMFLRAWLQNKTVEKMPDCVRSGFHAIAIDDERMAFDPTLWNESLKKDSQYIEQVWFAGMHANVGGGYPKDALAKVALQWMIARLKSIPEHHPDIAQEDVLQFNPMAENLEYEANVHSKMHDSRAGLAAFYRYHPRDLMAITRHSTGENDNAVPRIHESVFRRIQQKTNFYAPTNFSKLIVANDTSAGSVIHQLAYNSESENKVSSEISKSLIKSNIRSRKRLYRRFLTLTLIVLAMPKASERFSNWTEYWASLPGEQYLLKCIEALKNFLPDIAGGWLDWYGSRPILLIAVLLLYLLLRHQKNIVETLQAAENNDIWHNLNLDRLAQLSNSVAPALAKKSQTKIRGVKELGVVNRALRKMV